MSARRFALIGHSGAGKSACLIALGIDRKTADMDVVLGTRPPPPPLKTALSWLSGDTQTPSLVVVSNHFEMLRELAEAKLAGEYHGQFASVCFVYLRKPKDQLRVHLALPSAGGRARSQDVQRSALDNYDRFSVLFAQLADRTVDCSGRSVVAVVAELRDLAQLPEQG